MKRATSFLIASIAAAAPAFAAEGLQTVEIEGVAPVNGGDIDGARDGAVDDAKRKAVEQAHGGFVKSYQIKSEFKDGDTYHVKIKAVVDASAAADNVDQIDAVKPRVIVMIAEQNIGATHYAYWWGTAAFSSEMDVMQSALIAAWQPKGFKFVDPGALRGKIRKDRALHNPILSDGAIERIGKQADADIAIVGKVLVTDAGPVMDGVRMRSFHATGTLRVINVDTGEIITTADDSAVAPHIDGNTGGRLAIRALADKLSDPLEKAIMSKWTAEAAGGASLELVVEGAKDPGTLKVIERFLGHEVPGVDKVVERRRARGTAYLDVRYKGNGTGLGHAFDAKTFDGFTVEVAAMSKNRLTLAVRAKGAGTPD